MEIERAHRLGKFEAGKDRPVIVKFASFKVRQSVLSSAHRLKNTSYSISEDFSRGVREKRKILWDYAKINKQDGKKPVLKFDTLHLNGKRYQYDSDSGGVVEL